MDATKIMAGTALVIALGAAGKSLYTTDTKTLTVVSGKAEDESTAKLVKMSGTVKDIPCWTEYVQGEKDVIKQWMCQTDTGPAVVDEPEQVELTKLGGDDATAIVKRARQVGDTVVYDSEITRGAQPQPRVEEKLVEVGAEELKQP